MTRTLTAIVAFIIIILALAPIRVVAEPEETNGHVQLPLSVYNDLKDQFRWQEATNARSYVFGEVDAEVQVIEKKDAAYADTVLTFVIEVTEGRNQLVPVLPLGTQVLQAKMGNESVNLSPMPQGLSIMFKGPGTHTLTLKLRVPVTKSLNGPVFVLPLPAAASTVLKITLTTPAVDVSVIPANSFQVTPAGSATVINATLTTVQGVQVSWQLPSHQPILVTRAHYKGVASEEFVQWSAEFDVVADSDQEARIPLLPSDVTLTDVKIDGKAASASIANDMFEVSVQGKGEKKLTVDFQTRIDRTSGPAQVTLPTAQVPVSRVDLTLAGKKSVQMKPGNISQEKRTDTTTVATAYVPLGQNATFSWTDAGSEIGKEMARINTELFHTAYAADGLLHLQATAIYDIARGKVSTLEFQIPKGVDVSKVTASGTGISDWQVVPNAVPSATTATDGGVNILNVILDREVEGAITVDINYDQPISKAATGDAITLPLVRARGVHRQRGMAALFTSKEFSLKPVEELDVTKVGENQLPATLRQRLAMTVAHTYKYLEGEGKIRVQIAPPDKQIGRFDATTATLISVSDVTIKGSASVEYSVKLGTIAELTMDIPSGVNVLNLTAPSLRSYKVNQKEKGQEIEVQFTQDLDGQFRVELNYEQLLQSTESKFPVPLITIHGAEVEQGKIAVEALSVIGVQPEKVENLSLLDASELPRQLIAKTSNPILLSYKYIRGDELKSLALKLTRHREIEVASAIVDSASYRTLFTADGVAVTVADLRVRNANRQFLKIGLPMGSSVWSATVNGISEKPALAEEEGSKVENSQKMNVLVRIVNNQQGFPVQLVYQSPSPKFGRVGTIRAELPSLDLVASVTNWLVYLPAEYSYGAIDTNLEIGANGEPFSAEQIKNDFSAAAEGTGAGIGSLAFAIPSSGTRFSFKKLLAGKDAEAQYFQVSYAFGGVRIFLLVLILLLGAAAGWFVIGLRSGSGNKIAWPAVGGILMGIALLGAFGPLSLTAVLFIALLGALSAVGLHANKTVRNDASLE